METQEIKFHIEDDILVMTTCTHSIPLVRLNILREYMEVTLKDEYNDAVQRHTREEIDYRRGLVGFVRRNWKGKPSLEVGCGSGANFGLHEFTNAIEPNISRYKRALCMEYPTEVRLAVGECLPYPDNTFKTVVALGTWHYLRSQLEGFIEVNRVLQLGGVFILDFHIGDNWLFGGITMDPRSIISILGELGFQVQERRRVDDLPVGLSTSEVHALAITKLHNVDLKMCQKLQLVPTTYGTYHVNNFILERDNRLL